MHDLFEIKDTEHYDYPQLSIFYDTEKDYLMETFLKNSVCIEPNETAIYVHVPFCRSFCIFCNYYKEFPEEEMVESYLLSVATELEYYAHIIPSNMKKITAVHFGGGTPTAIGIKGLKKIVETIKHFFLINSNCLISTEAHVRDLQSIDFLKGLKEIGINRISFGIQSFAKEVREKYGLVPVKQIGLAINNLQKIGLLNYNTDIMYNFPEQNSQNVIDDIKTAFNYGVNNIDLYSLNVFPDTKMIQYLKHNGTYNRYVNNEQRNSYQSIYEYILENKYHLVMSNTISSKATTPNQYLKINLGSNRLNGGHVIGIGPSSRGYLNGFIYKNYIKLNDYVKEIKKKGNGRYLAKVIDDYEKVNRLFVMFPNFTYIKKEEAIFNDHAKKIMDRLIHNKYVFENEDTYYIKTEDCYWAGNISAMFYSEEQKSRMVKTLLLNKKYKLNMYNQDKMQIIGE